MAFEKLNSFTKKVADLPDVPSSTLQPSEEKAWFDAAPEELRAKYNELVDLLNDKTGASSLGAVDDTGAPSSVQAELLKKTNGLNGHKNAVELDHPDRSVTRRKIASGAVGTNELDPNILSQPNTLMGAQAQLQQVTEQLAENALYSFGVIGDGLADDTTSLQSLANSFSNSKSTKLQFERNKTYIITDVIRFDLTNKKHVEIDFNGSTIKLNSSFRYLNDGLFTLNFDKTIKPTCIIKNCHFDGSGNPPDFSQTNINPNGGRGAFFVNGATQVYMNNCHFNDLFYSACIWSHYAEISEITNCTGVRVGGRSADGTEDARGDALYFGYVGMADDLNPKDVNILVENCNFESWEALDNPGTNSSQSIKNVCQSGRVGIVLGEYSVSGKNKNFTIRNSRFYNYQRTFHSENTDNVNLHVENTSFEEYGTVLHLFKNSEMKSFKFSSCVFMKNKDVIGIAPGYNVIISGYTDAANIIASIDDSQIYGYGKINTYGIGMDLQIRNTKIEVEELTAISDCYIDFHNCDIKFNKASIFKSGLSFYNSEVVGGYKNDVNSEYFIASPSNQAPSKSNRVFKMVGSEFYNVSFFCLIKIFVNDCKFIYDSYFNPSYNGVTRKGVFEHFQQSLVGVHNSKFINNRSTSLGLFDTDNGVKITDFLFIANCYFENVDAKVFNTSPDFQLSFDNCKFKTAGILTEFINPYNSKITVKNSEFYGLSSGEFAYPGNLLKYNNYRIAGGVATVI